MLPISLYESFSTNLAVLIRLYEIFPTRASKHAPGQVLPIDADGERESRSSADAHGYTVPQNVLFNLYFKIQSTFFQSAPYSPSFWL